MTDAEKALLVILAVIIAVGIFWGIRTSIRKSFMSGEQQTTDTSNILTEQRRRAQEIRNQQKRLLESQKQKVRDARR